MAENERYIITNSEKGMWQLYKASTYINRGHEIVCLRFQKNISKNFEYVKDMYPDVQVIPGLKFDPNLIQDHNTKLSNEEIITRQQRLGHI